MKLGLEHGRAATAAEFAGDEACEFRRVPAEAAVADAEAGVLPVLPSTLLGLELLAQRPAFDLWAATRLVRDDPGAVLQVFWLLAQESVAETEPSMRLEDGIASLSRERLLLAMAGASASHGRSRFGAFAEHSVTVARSAAMVAQTLGLPATSARLLGLLHELGHAPAHLGWCGWPADAAVCCDRLARRHGLPSALRVALDEVHRETRPSVWVAVVGAAHELLPPRA